MESIKRFVESFNCLLKKNTGKNWEKLVGSLDHEISVPMRDVSSLVLPRINPIPSSSIQSVPYIVPNISVQTKNTIYHQPTKTLNSDCSKCVKRRTILTKLMTNNKKL